MSNPQFTCRNKTDSRHVNSGKGLESLVLGNVGSHWLERKYWSFFFFFFGNGLIFVFLSILYYLTSIGIKGAIVIVMAKRDSSSNPSLDTYWWFDPVTYLPCASVSSNIEKRQFSHHEIVAMWIISSNLWKKDWCKI